MTQAELNREIAQATGESLATIDNLGFVPLTHGPVEREAPTVDDEDLDAELAGLLRG